MVVSVLYHEEVFSINIKSIKSGHMWCKNADVRDLYL